MAALSLYQRSDIPTGKDHHHHQRHGATMVEEIEGLISVYKNGYVERPPLIPSVPCNVPPELRLTARDIVVDRFTDLWVRVYVPHGSDKRPFLVYFHGGGFCVGSASWSCYHDFLSNLACKTGCVIMSVDYRLAPENRLPVAYEDGFRTLVWVQKQAEASPSSHFWWLRRSNLACFFLAGDSAGANIAHNIALRINPVTSIPTSKPEFKHSIRKISLSSLSQLCHRGTILIQPFFGGEMRTQSERSDPQPLGSGLTLSDSDTYWRLALPVSANRDHPWCNPLINSAVNQLRSSMVPRTMVCLSEMDILMDRNKEFCSTMISAGKEVHMVMYKGVGHAFQILNNNSPLSKARTQEMMAHIKAFINK